MGKDYPAPSQKLIYAGKCDSATHFRGLVIIVFLLKPERIVSWDFSLISCDFLCFVVGCILEDEKIVSSYSIDEKKFIVVMVKKAPAPATSAAPSTPAKEEPKATTTDKKDDAQKPRWLARTQRRLRKSTRPALQHRHRLRLHRQSRIW